MNINKNLFILGAGFSNPIGLPSINEFYNKIKKIYLDHDKKLNKFLKKSFENVVFYREGLERVSARTNIDLDNIETLFSYFDMDSQGTKSDRDKLRKNMIYTIINTLDISTNMDIVNQDDNEIRVNSYKGSGDVKYRKGKEVNCALNIYEYFAYVLAGIIGEREYGYQRDDTIITFNYDIVLDNIFSFMGIPVNYCYENKKLDNTIKYLKLHGSANWLVCDKCRKITVFNKGYPKKPLKGCKKCGEKHAALEPLIVPPTWNKSEYRNEINQVWEVAINEMRHARKIFIIGYSIPPTDMYFEYLMSLGLTRSYFVDKVVVVDKDISRTNGEAKEHLNVLDEKYKKLLNANFIKYHYEFKPIGIMKFIKRDMPSYIGIRKV